MATIINALAKLATQEGVSFEVVGAAKDQDKDLAAVDVHVGDKRFAVHVSDMSSGNKKEYYHG